MALKAAHISDLAQQSPLICLHLLTLVQFSLPTDLDLHQNSSYPFGFTL